MPSDKASSGPAPCTANFTGPCQSARVACQACGNAACNRAPSDASRVNAPFETTPSFPSVPAADRIRGQPPHWHDAARSFHPRSSHRSWHCVCYCRRGMTHRSLDAVRHRSAEVPAAKPATSRQAPHIPATGQPRSPAACRFENRCCRRWQNHPYYRPAAATGPHRCPQLRAHIHWYVERGPRQLLDSLGQQARSSAFQP